VRVFAGTLALLCCGSLALGCGSDDNGSGTVDLFGDREPPRPSRAEILASDKVAETGARASVAPMEVYATDHQGTYVGATAATLKATDPAVPESIAVLAQATGYSVTVTSKVSDTEFTVTRAANRKLVFSCSAPGVGACSADGSWGA
jgi:hypothetical protein